MRASDKELKEGAEQIPDPLETAKRSWSNLKDMACMQVQAEQD